MAKRINKAPIPTPTPIKVDVWDVVEEPRDLVSAAPSRIMKNVKNK